MKLKVLTAAIALGALALTGCEESSTIGSSLMATSVDINIDSVFTVTGHSEEIGPMRPKTSTQLIGNISVPGYGTLSTGNVMQFLPATALDTANFNYTNVDSMAVKFRYLAGDFIGDSIVPMQLTLYRLTKQLPAGITSDFDPTGYYESQPLGSVVYNTSTMDNSTEAAASYHELSVVLPHEMGPHMFKTFEEHPEYFADGATFAQNVFPGVYAATTYGRGRLVRMIETVMTMWLTKIEDTTDDDGNAKKDTTNVEHQYFMVTPEVESNNNITFKIDPKLEAMKEAGDALIVSPGVYKTEIRFPAPEIVSSFKKADNTMAIVNNLTMTIPADSIANDFQIGPAPYLLMVLKKDRDSFFANNKLPDNQTSFYAEYYATDNSYSFSNLRSYIIDMMSRDNLTEEDYTFELIPVMVNFEKSGQDTYYSTSTYVETSVLPYVEGPSMARLRLNDTKIKFTYTLQSKK